MAGVPRIILLIAALAAVPLLTGCNARTRVSHEPAHVSPAPLTPVSVPVGLPSSPEAALADAERQVRQHPRDPRARRDLAALDRESGRLPEALRELRVAIRLAPRDGSAYRELARVYDQAHYLDREIEALKSVLRFEPSNWDAAITLAEIYMDFGWFQSAQPVLQLAANTAPSEPRVFLGLTTWASDHGRSDEMIHWAIRGMQLDPQSAEFHSLLSEAYRRQLHLPEAEREIRKAIALAPDAHSQSRYWIDLAHLLLMNGWPKARLAEAELAARTALKIDPKAWQAHYWLGDALRYQGKSNQALTEYLAVGRHDIQFESTAYQIGRLFQRSTDPRQRAQAAGFLAVAGQADRNQRQYEDVRATVSTHPLDPVPHAALAIWWYVRMNRLPEAIVELRRAMELKPDDPVARQQLITVLKASGRETEARRLSRPGFRYAMSLAFSDAPNTGDGTGRRHGIQAQRQE